MGKGRSVSAAFVYSIINVLELPGVFYILGAVHPLLVLFEKQFAEGKVDFELYDEHKWDKFG